MMAQPGADRPAEKIEKNTKACNKTRRWRINGMKGKNHAEQFDTAKQVQHA